MIKNSKPEEPIILIADPAVLAIPVKENHEAMIDLINQDMIAYGPPPLVPTNTDYTKMRKTVYEKLVEAQKMLPAGLKFQLYEAHRSLELQQAIFDERYTKLQKQHPELSHAEIFKESTKFASPVIHLDGSKNIPPHSTGAAIDVYLIDSTGNVVDMGIHLDDTYDDLEGIYCHTNSQAISQIAQKNRQMMGEALSSVGLVNYPTEYWHWSYGDRYWAFHKNQPFAMYGSK